MKHTSHSPVVFTPKIVKMCFSDALERVMEGKKITRLEWDDKRDYGIMKDELLFLHKNGEKEDKLHPWIISLGDMVAKDWIIL